MSSRRSRGGVERLWAGRRPSAAEDIDDDVWDDEVAPSVVPVSHAEDAADQSRRALLLRRRREEEDDAADEVADDDEDRAIQEPVIIVSKRLGEAGGRRGQEIDSGVQLSPESLEQQVDSDVDDEEVALRRQRALERLRERESVQDFDLPGIEERVSEGSSGSEESEYETDSEADVVPLSKPVFIHRENRDTVLAREKAEELEREKEIEEEERLEVRKEESLRIAMDHSTLAEEEGVEDDNPFDDDEETDDEKEFVLWKEREMKRIQRDIDEKEKKKLEKDAVEERRQMTDDQIKKENAKLKGKPREKTKIKYLQRYYHKGAFFLDDDDEILKRDFNAPTGEDLVDKDLLPKPMQVKKYGKIGRTKYTHLVDQDTTLKLQEGPASDVTSFRRSAIDVDKSVENGFQKRMGGMKGTGFQRPSKRQRT